MKNFNQQHNSQNQNSHWQFGGVVCGSNMNKGGILGNSGAGMGGRAGNVGHKQQQNKNMNILLGDFN